MENYKVPNDTKIGHVHLKVSNLQQSIDFYCGLLGFDITQTNNRDVAFISAGGYHHHIGLNTWHSKDTKAVVRAPGLYHTAILYPTRKDLAEIFKRITDATYPLTGASDHGVSEALYLDDPDGNGVELYWDKPKEIWPKTIDGSLNMYTRHLDLEGLLKELNT